MIQKSLPMQLQIKKNKMHQVKTNDEENNNEKN